MSEFQNTPRVNDAHTANTIKRYVHQPLTVDHYGIRAKIQENGKVLITGIADKDGIFDEIEVPASLIFKLTSLLKATRSIQYVDVTETKR